MPQTDQEKDTMVLLAEIKSGVPGNLTAIHAKLDELDNREIKNGDPDDIEIGGLNRTRGAVRPKTAPIVP